MEVTCGRTRNGRRPPRGTEAHFSSTVDKISPRRHRPFGFLQRRSNPIAPRPFHYRLGYGRRYCTRDQIKKALQAVDKNYDLIICDCPPNLTIPTQNALAASSHFVVPISADFLSSLGVGILLSRIKELGQDLDQELTLAGIVISRVGRPAFHRDEIVNTLRSQFPNDVLTNSLSERVKVAEAAAKNSPIFDMNDVIAAAEFERVCTDLASRIGV